jgi:hypothetical protein
MASTTNTAIFMVICALYVNSYRFRLQIGVGASGSESAICDMMFYPGGSTGKQVDYSVHMVRIPAGSRISARCSCATASQYMSVGCWLVEVPY